MSFLTDLWALFIRLVTGFFWLFFASQRWFNPGFVEEVFKTAASNNYLPIYGDLLRTLVDSWLYVVVGVTVLETVVGAMLVFGIYPRLAAAIGAATALNLFLTFIPCSCPWNVADAPMVFWFYFATLLLNLSVLRERHRLLVLRTRTSKHS